MRHRKHSKDSAQSETPSMHGNSTRENREAPSVPIADKAVGRLEKAMSQESNKHAGGESVELDRSRALEPGSRPLRCWPARAGT